ncbi:hypothetical protein AB0A77_28360 [Streptomyces varsoviensis]|uniref:hypothetical protein n=1 Tax=Streptomyces varsoviensis TaxID=67373 RepID=UPI0033FEF6B0
MTMYEQGHGGPSFPSIPPMPPLPPAVRRSWWRRPGVLVAGGLFVVGAAAGGVWAAAGGEPEEPFTLRGTVVLKSGATTATQFDAGGDCMGYEGYDDIVPGASVTVFDSGGKVVATGSLGKGSLPEGAMGSVPCSFPFAVAGVPKGERFYQVEVSHRGKVTVTAEVAEAGRFAASLG